LNQIFIKQFIYGINSLVKYSSLVLKKRDISLDETKIKSEGKRIYLWTAVDVYTKEVIAITLSKTRYGLDTYFFLKKVI